MTTFIVAFIAALVVGILMGVLAYRRGYRHGDVNCHKDYVSAFNGILEATRKAIRTVKGEVRK